jgi:SAM-dependent methyltransferase
MTSETSPFQAPSERALAQDHASLVNERLWRRNHVARYANRELRPVEVILLARYRDALAGRTLELGCGAGRVLGYLGALGGEVHGIDISQGMVDYCRRRYPETTAHVGSLSNIAATVPGPFDAVFAPDNVLDVVDPDQRRRVLEEIRGLLKPDGVLIFSSHNLAHVDVTARRTPRARAVDAARRLALCSLAQMAMGSVRSLRGARNRRRLAALQRRAEDHAILNDSEGDYGALHYYVRRDDQERQLGEVGFVLLECLDAEGRLVTEGGDGDSPWLHYVARPA